MHACGCIPLGQDVTSALDVANQSGNTSSGSGELATTMVLRGAVGTLIGAAASPPGQEGVWGAVGFVMGATLGEIGIVGVALAALWKKGG